MGIISIQKKVKIENNNFIGVANFVVFHILISIVRNELIKKFS